MNEKLRDAIWALGHLLSEKFSIYESKREYENRYRNCLLAEAKCNIVSLDDPWVAAALGCVDDADIPDVALEFFLADVKAGLYDMPIPDPSAVS
jgi:hypothetical protein